MTPWYWIPLGTEVNGGTFAEDAFGIDDNMWFDPTMQDENGDWIHQELYEYDVETGELVPIEGDGPFWNEGGEYWGHDWLWRDADGRIFAYTDREYFIYHFPGMLEEYIYGVKKDLGYQNETSLVLGVDFYHYGENWWIHAWGNWLPIHYGHSTMHIIMLIITKTFGKGGKPHKFMYMIINVA